MSGFQNNLKTALLLGLLTGLVLWIGSLFGTGGLYVALVMTAVMNFVSYFFSDKIAIMAMRAEEVGPEHELYGIAEGLVRRANLPMPRVYVAPHDAPNAFATGRSPHHAAVCATEGLLRMLSREEVAGVMAHELAHVKHRDILIQSVATTIGGAISMLGYMFMFGGGGRSRDGEGANPLAGLAVLILGPIAAGLIQMAVSRSREFEADRGGAEILGSAMPLATALEKIHLASQRIPLDVNPALNSLFIAEPRNTIERTMNLFASHPPLEQRLLKLIGRESTGMFARPAA
jgi:heat shock protein HtpX